MLLYVLLKILEKGNPLFYSNHIKAIVYMHEKPSKGAIFNKKIECNKDKIEEKSWFLWLHSKILLKVWV